MEEKVQKKMQKSDFFCIYRTREIVYKVEKEHLTSIPLSQVYI